MENKLKTFHEAKSTMGISACCASCKFWLEFGMWDGEKALPYRVRRGKCRRYPPVKNDSENSTYPDTDVFPVTEEDDCCGEHPGVSPS